MNTPLTIKEKIDPLWKYGTSIAGVLTLLFSLLFWNLSDPLWVGIFRLVAFIFFSYAVFGILKQLGGPLRLVISYTPEYLHIKYSKKEKIVQQEKIELNTIREFTIVEESSLLDWLSDYPKPATLHIRFRDQDHSRPLFEHDGRILFFDRKTISETDHYLRETLTFQKQTK